MPERESPPPAWKLESSRMLEEYDMFGVRHDRARDPETGEVRDLHVAAASPGVTVIALTERGELVMVEQYRHGTRSLSLETPSGVMDEGEEPVAAALRELREETGYSAEGGRVLATLSHSPSWQDAPVHVVLAHGVGERGEKRLDEGEATRVRLVPLERAHALAREGGIESAVVVAALFLHHLHAR